METNENLEKIEEQNNIRGELNNLAKEIHESIDQTMSDRTDKSNFNPYKSGYSSWIDKNPKY